MKVLLGKYIRGRKIKLADGIHKGIIIIMNHGIQVHKDNESFSVGSNSLPPNGLYRILQARILEWVAFPFSRRASQLRD